MKWIPKFDRSSADALVYIKGCDHQGCPNPGVYPAPKNLRLNRRDRFWFCLEHVRAYNESWNYTTLTPDADTFTITPDPLLEKVALGKHGRRYRIFVDDPLGVTPLNKARPGHKSKQAEAVLLTADQQAALELLQLAYPFTRKQLRAHYLKLVKVHHPDRHGHAPQAVEMLQSINQAYELLKKGIILRETS